MTLALALLPLLAHAVTWQWRDAGGQMVYSDQPPPPDVRPSQIIRGPAPVTVAAPPVAPAAAPDAAAKGPSDASAQPAGISGAPGASAASGVSGGAAAQRSAAPGSSPKNHDDRFQSWADRDMAFRKRMAERDDAARKDKEARDEAARLARACDDARGSLRTLESGMRIVTLDARGEQVTMDDAERARRIDSVRRDVSRQCGAG
ncbi:MAG: DUF4124 domain-containing protein [Burkholderiaceae bacterium]